MRSRGQKAHEAVSSVPSSAWICHKRSRHIGEAERIIEFAVEQQAAIGTDR